MSNAKKLEDFSRKLEIANLEGACESGLLEAAKKGDSERVRWQLNRKVSVHARDPITGFTSLHMAAEAGHEEVLIICLDRKAKVEEQTSQGWTALHLAASNCRDATLLFLLEWGVNLSARDNDGCTALHLACMRGHDSTAKLLMDFGADLDDESKWGSTALHYACQSGNDSLVTMLLALDADIESECHQNTRPLHRAAYFAKPKCVTLLLEANCDKDCQDDLGDTPLHKAVRRAVFTVVELLVEGGADPTIRNNNGQLPQDLTKNPYIREYLFEASGIPLITEAEYLKNLGSPTYKGWKITNAPSRYRYKNPALPIPTILPSRSNVSLTIVAPSAPIFGTPTRPLALPDHEQSSIQLEPPPSSSSSQEMTVHSKNHK